MTVLHILKISILWICFSKIGTIASVYGKIDNENDKAILRTFFVLYVVTLILFLIVS